MTINLNKPQNQPKRARIFTLSLVSLLFALTATLVSADDHIIFVDASASGSANGSSWANAFTDLQAAFDIAEAGDEIWVADGVYKPSKQTDMNDARSATFQLIEGVKLYGGFAGGEASIEDRAWETNQTILSGDIDNNDQFVDDNNGITIKYEYAFGTNAYNVIIGDNGTTYTNATVIDGFIITAGITTGLGGEAGISDGAGIRFGDGNSPILRNLHVIGTRSTDDGGGIYFKDNNNPILENVTVENTFATDFGGAIFFFDGNNPTFRDVSIINSAGSFAAGVYINDNSIVDIVNFYACGNIMNFTSSNAFSNAGTTLSFGSDNTISITNAVFSANVANENGSALRLRGDNDVTLTNVTITGNQAGDSDISVPMPGGAIFTREPGNVFTIANSIIWGNDQIYGWGEGGEPTVNATYSIIGEGAAPTGIGNVASPTSPFITDPTFGADETWGTDDDTCGDLGLLATSSAINSGSNSAIPADTLDVDDDGDTTESTPLTLDQTDRILNETVDMGAYETFTPLVDQTITFTSPENNSEGLIDEVLSLVATASSGLAVSFDTLTPSLCTVAGTQLTLIGSGNCRVQASQAGNGAFSPAASVTHTITVGKRFQEITFPTPPNLAEAMVGDTVPLSATATSELPVTFVSNSPSVCSVSGTSVEILTFGLCEVEANQSGDSEWAAAEAQTISFVVGQPASAIYLPIITR